MNNKDSQANYRITRLVMLPHPKGGYFKEVYRPLQWQPINGILADRRILTTIYYLLQDSDYSAFYRIKLPESWLFS